MHRELKKIEREKKKRSKWDQRLAEYHLDLT